MSPVTKPRSTSTSKVTDEDGAWKINEETGKKERNTRALPFENKLNTLLLDAAALISFQDEFTAGAIQHQAPEIAYGWARLGQEDPRVKRVLAFILEGSAWAEALIPTLTLGVAVAWHYGILVPDRIGVPMALAVGNMPMSREVETKMKEDLRAQAKVAVEDDDHEKPINGDDSST